MQCVSLSENLVNFQYSPSFMLSHHGDRSARGRFQARGEGSGNRA